MAGNNYNELRLFFAKGNAEPREVTWGELDVLAPAKAPPAPLNVIAEVEFQRTTAQRTANISSDVKTTIAQVDGNDTLRNGINIGAQTTGCPVEDYISLLANETSGGVQKKVHTKEVKGPDGKPIIKAASSASGDFQITDVAYHDMLRRYGPQYMAQMQSHIMQQYGHSPNEGVRAVHAFDDAVKHVADHGPAGDNARALLAHYKNDSAIQSILVGASRQALVAGGADPKYFRLAHTYGRAGMDAVLTADRANPDARIDSVLNTNALRNNMIDGGISVKSFLDEMVNRPDAFTREARNQLQAPATATRPQRVAQAITPDLVH